MKRGAPDSGFTMVEVMIVLAVSIALLASAMLMFSGKIQQNQFAQSVRELDTTIQGVINQVASGAFSELPDDCDSGSDGPDFSSGSVNQGAHTKCIFLGKVIHFSVGGTPDALNIYTVVGSRTDNVTGVNSKLYSEAKPTVAPQITEEQNTAYGLAVTAVFVGSDNSSPNRRGMMGVFIPLQDTSGDSVEALGQSTAIIPIRATSLNDSLVTVEASGGRGLINALNVVEADAGLPITICLASGTNNQRAAILVNAANTQGRTDVLFDNTVPSGCPA